MEGLVAMEAAAPTSKKNQNMETAVLRAAMLVVILGKIVGKGRGIHTVKKNQVKNTSHL